MPQYHLHLFFRLGKNMKNSFIPTAYLRLDCPFSFKFLLFITEARILDKIKLVQCHLDDDNYKKINAMLEEKTGTKASFPTVEIEEGCYQAESDDLITYFAQKNNISVGQLPTLTAYKVGLLPRIISINQENEALKAMN